MGSVAFQKNALYSKKVDAEDNVISPKIPTLLEMTAYVFFVGGYFVGPQFSLNHYRRAISQSIDGLNRYLSKNPIKFYEFGIIITRLIYNNL